ncbi:F-box domain containing protein [Tanacetum coccineum]
MGSTERSRDEKIMNIGSRKRARGEIITSNGLWNIPDDVLWDVLIRLPAKTLARMRGVSKPWNALLSHPSFINSHLEKNMNTYNKDDDEVLLAFDEGFFHTCQTFITCPSRSSILQISNIVKLPPLSDDSYIIFVGSVNGIICFADYQSGDFYIWNPSLSALTALPPYTAEDDSLFRFGFDPIKDDYKVVIVSFRDDEHGDIVKGSIKVGVYSLRKGSWKSVPGFPSHITMISNKDEVCADGHVYWLCNIDNSRETIVSFNLGLETFHEISLPQSIQVCNAQNVLGVLSKKLCVMSCIRNGDCEVWVMDDDGWVKHHTFPPFDTSIAPICFTPSNLFLFGVDDRLALYDPDAAAVKLFTSNIFHSRDAFHKIVHYADSLVWVPPAPKCATIEKKQD